MTSTWAPRVYPEFRTYEECSSTHQACSPKYWICGEEGACLPRLHVASWSAWRHGGGPAWSTSPLDQPLLSSVSPCNELTEPQGTVSYSHLLAVTSTEPSKIFHTSFIIHPIVKALTSMESLQFFCSDACALNLISQKLAICPTRKVCLSKGCVWYLHQHNKKSSSWAQVNANRLKCYMLGGEGSLLVVFHRNSVRTTGILWLTNQIS